MTNFVRIVTLVVLGLCVGCSTTKVEPSSKKDCPFAKMKQECPHKKECMQGKGCPFKNGEKGSCGDQEKCSGKCSGCHKDEKGVGCSSEGSQCACGAKKNAE